MNAATVAIAPNKKASRTRLRSNAERTPDKSGMRELRGEREGVAAGVAATRVPAVGDGAAA